MRKLNFEEVKEFFADHDWEIRDNWEPPNEDAGPWSITAHAERDIRISVDEPSEEVTLNNIIIESPSKQLEGVNEYDTAVSIANDYPGIRVRCLSKEGLFQQIEASEDIDLTKRENVKRHEAKDVSFGVQFVVTKTSEEIELEEIPDFVEKVRKALYKLDLEKK